MNGIRALVFDTFGTLVDWRGGMIAHLSSWGDARGIRADWPTLVYAWRMIAFAGASERGRISTCCTASPSNVWRRPTR
jgi:2-haloacid dehalogenase